MSQIAQEAKQWIGRSFAYHYDAIGAMQRASAAKALGLDPALYGQMTPGGSTFIVNIQDTPPAVVTQTPPAQTSPAPAPPAAVAPPPPQAAPPAAGAPARAASRLGTWLAAGALALAGSGTTAGLMALWHGAPAAVQPAAGGTQPAAGTPGAGQPMERVIHWWVAPDGQFHQTSRDVPAGSP